MCGIVGVYQKNGRAVAGDRLLAARDCLSHRGPDDAGIFIDGSIGLAHRRLSILDLSSGGHQPMSTSDGRYTIIFNGEIYNYEELRRAHLRDENLRSTSDTEVLLHLLARFGEKALPWLKGMFAFALWDAQERRLLLARDAFGKKPLYYIQTEAEFLFASEPKALLAYGRFPVGVDTQASERYLLHEYVPAPATGFEGIRQLSMGQAATIDAAGTLEIRQWWQPTFLPKTQMGEKAALRKLDELLGQAVQRRMISDVPVGVFLSGGLDSTTIAWYMKQAVDTLHSCSMAFSEATFDESFHITMAVQHLHTIHHASHFGPIDVPRLLAQVTPLMDVPLADASLLPTFAVSLLARKHMKVVLSGDGADELFGGYGTFQAANAAQWLHFLPQSVWPAVEALVKLLPVSHDYFSLDFKLKSFVRGLPYPAVRRNQVWLGSFSPPEIARLLQEPGLSTDALFADVDGMATACQGLDLFDSTSCLTIHHYLQDDILPKLDRATMMASLEARTPFLDVDLAEFVMKLPTHLKEDKYLLKKLMRGRIPAAIIDRPKKGFGLPLGLWMRGELKPWLLETLSRRKVEEVGWRWDYVEALLREHIGGRADHRKKLWTLVMWLAWAETWIQKKHHG